MSDADADLTYTPTIVERSIGCEALYYIPKGVGDDDQDGRRIALNVVRCHSHQAYMVDDSYENSSFYRLVPVKPFLPADDEWQPILSSRIDEPEPDHNGLLSSTRTYYIRLADVDLCKLLYGRDPSSNPAIPAILR